MMDRAAIEGIVSGLPTDTLLRALQVAGVQVGDPMQMADEEMVAAFGVPWAEEYKETWQDKKVPVGDSPMAGGMPLHSPEMYKEARKARGALRTGMQTVPGFGLGLDNEDTVNPMAGAYNA